tara:strand:+ start:4348 stop:5052 length:705 start_codon:yes stop_codon:yes gene_type:complete
MKTTVAQFIPIIVIITLLSYSNEFVNMSNTILGKIFAICIVLFYTSLDKYMGLVLCLLVIVYYQSDFVENMLNTDDMMDKLFENFEASKTEALSNPTQGDKQIQDGDKKKSQLQENMSSLSDVYAADTQEDEDDDEEPGKEGMETRKEGMATVSDFRKQNCKGKKLLSKGSEVKPDMVKHIFPNVEFTNHTCNVCDDSCNFSIIENRLKTEKELFSKFSRDEDNVKESACSQCK